MKVTGWDNGLCQDYDKGLGRWFANRLGARQQLRQDFKMTQVLIDRATLELVLRTLNRLRYDNDSVMAEEGFHEAAEALRAALANAETAGWQKIETAPKDGSFYLAFGEGKTWTQNQPNGCYPGEWHFSESRGEWRGHALTNDATHWMPLPEPPK